MTKGSGPNTYPVFCQLRVPPADVPAPTLPRLPNPGRRFLRPLASRSPRDSTTGAPQGPKNNGALRQSPSPTGTKSCSKPEGVAPPSSHLHHASFIKIGRAPPRSLCHHRSCRRIRFPAPAPTVDAYSSDVPRQPPLASCGKHIPWSCRGAISSRPRRQLS